MNLLPTSSSTFSSVLNPGGFVAISKRIPPGSRNIQNESRTDL
ncbi:MAG TPA: hypothetical protein VE619_05320 [Nitrososphaeraceae archaeon]|nr:hypothetical protein [Nitrososphaeraceae archaeon]